MSNADFESKVVRGASGAGNDGSFATKDQSTPDVALVSEPKTVSRPFTGMASSQIAFEAYALRESGVEVTVQPPAPEQQLDSEGNVIEVGDVVRIGRGKVLWTVCWPLPDLDKVGLYGVQGHETNVPLNRYIKPSRVTIVTKGDGVDA